MMDISFGNVANVDKWGIIGIASICCTAWGRGRRDGGGLPAAAWDSVDTAAVDTAAAAATAAAAVAIATDALVWSFCANLWH